MLQTIQIEPFPTLTWNNYSWTCDITLPAWQGFQERQGSYGSISSQEPSQGFVTLNVATEDDEPDRPTPEQGTAFQYLLDNQNSIHDAIVKAVFDGYAELQESYGYDEDKAKEYMPDIDAPNQLKSLIGLSTIHILTPARAGVAYVGFEFGCLWDEEHGLGVMTHKGRVIDVGGADTSFVGPAAEEDAENLGSGSK